MGLEAETDAAASEEEGRAFLIRFVMALKAAADENTVSQFITRVIPSAGSDARPIRVVVLPDILD